MSSSTVPAVSVGFRLGLNDGTLGFLATAILLVSAVVWSARIPNLEKVDFSLTYVGATIVHSGLGSRLYEPDLQKRTRDSLFQHPNPLFFEHPPFEALLLSPLAPLGFRTAYALWGFLNAGLWLLLIFFLRPYLPWPNELLGYLCLWLIFAPLAVALYQGQTSIILLAFFAIAYTQLKNGREFSAGVALGFGLIKFQFAVPFALIFLFRRKWGFIGGFLISAAILAVLSIATVGFRGVEQYARFLLTIAGNPQNLSYGSAVDMPTLHGFLYALFGETIGHVWLNIGSGCLSLLLLVWLAWRSRLADFGSSADLSFGVAIAASLLAGHHMFTHDFSPLILGMFLAGAHLRETTSGRRAAMALTLAAFWTFPMYFLFVAWHCLYLLCPILLLFTYLGINMAKENDHQRIVKIDCVRA